MNNTKTKRVNAIHNMRREAARRQAAAGLPSVAERFAAWLTEPPCSCIRKHTGPALLRGFVCDCACHNIPVSA